MNNIDIELLDTVSFHDHPTPGEMDDALEHIESLLKAGADPNFTNED